MAVLFANNAKSTLAGPITSTAVSVSLAAGTGAIFPQPGAGDFFVMTFVDAATKLINEIVHVTNVSADTMTIVRAQENTTARAWLAGDGANNFLTAGTLALAITDSLGFTPVQQGGGTLQGTNKIFMGWDATNSLVRVEVDSTDMAGLAFQSWVSSHFLALSGGTVTGAVTFGAGLTTTTVTASGNIEAASVNTSGSITSGLDMSVTRNLGVNGIATILGAANVSGIVTTPEVNTPFITDSGGVNIGGAPVQITNTAGTTLAPLNLAVGTTGNQAVSIAQFQFSTGGIAGFPSGGGTNPGSQVQFQFGTITAPGDSTAHSYAFPTSFPNACLAVVISYGAETPPSNGSIGAQTQNANSFVVTNTAPSGSNGCYFIAIGW